MNTSDFQTTSDYLYLFNNLYHINLFCDNKKENTLLEIQYIKNDTFGIKGLISECICFGYFLYIDYLGFYQLLVKISHQYHL